MNKKGILYGVGTGPGNPELLTLKAVRVLKEADVIALPTENADTCISYRTVLSAMPEIADKELLTLNFTMTKDKKILDEVHNKNADCIRMHLDNGKSVAFLTAGDPVIYSTYAYVHNILKNEGYETSIVNGVTSFCAAAASHGTMLCQGNQTLRIIPASYMMSESDYRKTSDNNGSSEDRASSETLVLMKAARSYQDTVRMLRKHSRNAIMAENCTMDNEKLYYSIDEFPENAAYFTLIISKENGDL